MSVTGTGANPVPSSWVSAVTPANFTFNTGSNQGQPKTARDDTQSLTVSFSVPANAIPGTYTAKILVQPAGGSGVGGGSGTTVTLNVGDFSLSASPASLSLVRGGSAATSTITLSSLFQFNSPVALSASASNSSGHPENGISLSFSSTPVTPPAGGSASSTLTIAAANNVQPGSYTVQVTGTGGGQTHTLTIPVTVTNFSMSCSPAAVSVIQGQSGTSTVSAQSINGFSSPVTLSCSGQPAGVTCSFSPGSVTPPANSTAASTLTIAVGPTAVPGPYTLTVSGASAGVSRTATVALTVVLADTTPPTSTATPSPAPNAAGWQKGNVTVALAATDGGTGVMEIVYSATGAQTIASTTVSGASASVGINAEGITTLTFFARDNAGNVESVQTLPIKIDKSVPSASAVISPDPNAAGWHKTDVTVTLNAADVGPSGLKRLTYSINGGASTDVLAANLPQAIAITTDGITSISFHATDSADNVNTTQTVTVKRDTLPPAVSPADLTNPDWRNTDLSQTFTATDAGSGLANASDASFTLAASAESILLNGVAQPTVVTRTVTDIAGNSTTRTVSALIDKTAPVITPGAPQGTPGHLVGGVQWYLSDVTVPVTTVDPLSGLQNPGADMSFALGTSGEGSAVATPSRDVFDKAGNKAVAGPFTFAVDKTPPAVTPADLIDTNWRNTNLSQTFLASDGPAGSGLADPADASFTLTAAAESAGASSPTVVTRTVSDLAGNATTRTVSALIDKTAPVIEEGAMSGILGNLVDGQQWYRSDVTVHYSASDPLSGLNDAGDASLSLSTSGEGSAQSTGSRTVSDVAGNTAVAGPRTFAVDKTPPTLDATPDRDPDQNGWYTGPVHFDFAGHDPVSGVAHCSAAKTYGGPDSATAFVEAECEDVAGNATSRTFTFKYDATPPVLHILGVSEGSFLQSAAVSVTADDLALTGLFAKLNGAPRNPAGFAVTDEGAYTLLASATDAAGHTTSQTVNFTIDQTAPVVQFDEGSPLDGGFYNQDVTLNYYLWDNLDPNPFFTLQQRMSQLVTGDADPFDILSPHTIKAEDQGRHTIKLLGEDHAGNHTSESRTFLIDTQAPATAAAVTGVAASNGWFKSPVAVNLTAVDPDIRPEGAGLTAIPGSGVAALGYSADGAQTIGSTLLDQPSVGLTITQEGVTTLHYQAKDRAGNEEPAHDLVVRFDKTAPELTVPGDMVVEATSKDGAAVQFSISAQDNVDPEPALTCDHPSGGTFPLGATLVTCKATDAAGNERTKSFTITVQDTTPPVIENVPANIVKEATSAAGAVVDFPAPTATDTVDGSVQVVCNPASGSTFPLGTTTVHCTATDAHGNKATESFTVKVEDTTPPAIGAVHDIVAEATGSDGAAVTFDTPTAEDTVDGAVGVICNPTSGSTFPLGTKTVTCTATDAHGNTATKTFTITVVDTTPPSINEAPNLVAEATGPDGAAVTFTAPAATDLVDGPVTVHCQSASGATFPLGTTTVTCTAKDAAGNQASTTFTVTVQDTTPPAITVPDPITVEATGPNGAAVAFTATASDKVDGDVQVVCDPPSGSTFPLGESTVTCTAIDAHGNKASRSFTVTVIDTIAPEIHTPAPVVVEATGAAGAAVSFTVTASDVVDGAVGVTCDPASGSTFPLGTTTVHCTATDAHGNKAGATFTVKVEDTTAPAIGTAPDVTAEATGPDGTVVTFSDPAATDAVGPVTVTCAPASGSPFPLGASTVTCTATDGAGNHSTKTFHVLVQDTTPPTITSVPGDKTVEATSPAGAVVTFTTPTATDIVDGAVPVTCAPPSGATFPRGTTTVTCTAKDAAGNMSTETFTVTVEDTIAPVTTATVTPAPNAAGWQHSNVTVTLAATDSGSGVKEIVYSATGAQAIAGTTAPGAAAAVSLNTEGDTTLTFAARDQAGNLETAQSITVHLDKTAPLINAPDVTVTATSATGAVVNYAPTATDALSGLVGGVICSPPSGGLCPLGTSTVNSAAADAADNTCAKPFKVSVLYGWAGIQPPINPDGSSVFKQGSTVPVKFKLAGASAAIANATAKLYCAKISNGVVGSELEAISTSAADTGNTFRYDSTGAQYIFNLGTKSLTEGTYQLRIDLGDGVCHAVNISLKR